MEGNPNFLHASAETRRQRFVMRKIDAPQYEFSAPASLLASYRHSASQASHPNAWRGTAYGHRFELFRQQASAPGARSTTAASVWCIRAFGQHCCQLWQH